MDRPCRSASRSSASLAARCAGGAALVGAALFASGNASAARDEFAVTVHAENQVETTFLTQDREPIQTCIGDCVVRLPRGSYRVEAAGDGVSRRTKRFEVDGEVRVDVRPGDRGTKNAGLALGITGGAVAVVSAFALMVASVETLCIDCTRSKQLDATPYLFVAGAGVVVSAIGWTLFGLSGTSVDVTAGHASAAWTAPRVAFGVAPTKGGAYGALGFAF
jgi:hypothetical protein